MDFLHDDLARAQELQRAFLPALADQDRDGVHVTAAYRPAYQVGGDFYDVVHLPDGRLTVMIGDVAGKGVAAALLMARVSTEFRRLADLKMDPRRILQSADQWLERLGLVDRFVTAACVQLQPARRRWIAANAGHVVPLLRRRDGTIIALSQPSGLPLGLGTLAVQEDLYVEDEVPAMPGDIVLMVTDGILEFLTGETSNFGLDSTRLSQLMGDAPHDLEAIQRAIFDSVETTDRARDDATLVAVALDDNALPASVSAL